MKKTGYIFCIIIGLSMIAMWCMLLLTGQVKEMKSEPIRISAHLLSEAVTAISLLLGGLLSLKNSDFGKKLHLISLGLLLYSVLTAGGYYFEQGNLAMVVMFSTFFVATVVFIVCHLSKSGKSDHTSYIP